MADLQRDPEDSIASLDELVGIANAIEAEAVKRYTWLAEAMERHGDSATAQAFRNMAEEELRHVAAVQDWAERLGHEVPKEGAFTWRLPPELGTSWDEAAASALLTPYRAYAIAVENEQRAFAFYAFLAARAEDPAIAQQAETLAAEELRHAALLRTWRRSAWRVERGGADYQPLPREIAGAPELAALIAEREEEIARRHKSLARRLLAVGDGGSAGVLLGRDDSAATAGGDLESASVSVGLLLEAERPLERLSETLEAALETAPDEETQTLAQEALTGTVARIARIGRRIEALETR